jgi:hypothetical protein
VALPLLVIVALLAGDFSLTQMSLLPLVVHGGRRGRAHDASEVQIPVGFDE